MKTIFTLCAVLVLTFFTFNKVKSQNCNYSAGNNGVSIATPSSIVINGNMSDWSMFLNDPDNNSYDNTSGNDGDSPIADAGRDLTKFTFTENANYLFIYLERAGSANNSVDIIFYADINNNDYMELNEPVIQINWSGANGNVFVSVHNYIPSVTSLLNRISSNLDGSALWGTLGYRGAIGNTGKGSVDGKSVEVRIPFSDLTQLDPLGNVIKQLQFGQDFKFHISTINGNVSSIPNSNSINDNFGGCLTAPLVVLPVKLNNFQGSKNKNSVQLQWNVGVNEIANTFEVERSTDGKNFETAALLSGTEKAGNETYSYNEVNEDAKVYYRLKMVDKSDVMTYSKILVFNTNNKNTKTLDIIGNSVNDKLTVSFQSEANNAVELRILDMNGKMIVKHSIKASKGNNLVSFSLPATMNTGMYIASLSSENINSTAKFIKQ